MNASSPGCSNTDSNTACELGIRASHKGCRFFMPHVDKSNPRLLFAERLKDSINAVAGKAEDCVYTPRDESLYQYIRCIHHFKSPQERCPSRFALSGWTEATMRVHWRGFDGCGNELF